MILPFASLRDLGPPAGVHAGVFVIGGSLGGVGAAAKLLGFGLFAALLLCLFFRGHAARAAFIQALVLLRDLALASVGVAASAGTVVNELC